MIFLNVIMLAGLAAVAIPVIIHILNRRQVRMVEWGAMMFLAESLASRSRRILLEEIILMVLRCVLLAALALALARPFLTGRILATGGRDAQDIVIVLDGSLSMTLEVDGVSNFQRAIDEAHRVVQAARRGDSIGLIVAGATAEAVVPTPVSDRQVLHSSLDQQTAPGGSLAALEALQAALLSAQAGGAPAKKIVLITDGQSIGWDLGAEDRWAFLAAAAEGLPTAPLVIVRTLDAPTRWRNLCLSELSLSRAIVGTDRAVTLSATVTNTAAGAVTAEMVEFSVDGEVIGTAELGELVEGAAGSAIFDHRFEEPGPHVISARILCEDDLTGDNRIDRAVNVLEDLPVLIIEGRPSTQPLGSAAAYIESALTPEPEEGHKYGDVFRPRTVAAPDVETAGDLSQYCAVILAGAARLPAARAKELAEFVAAGGGLLVAPGEKAESSFYNKWTAPDGKAMLGAALTELHSSPAEKSPERIQASSLDHPALKILTDPDVNDLATARIHRYWKLEVETDESVSVAARLAGGDPYIVQRKCGAGYVLTLATPLDQSFSDLPLKKSYLPLVHEVICYLAQPSRQPLNILPGQQFVCELPAKTKPGQAEVIGPGGLRKPAQIEMRRSRWCASFAMTARPGLYRLRVGERETPFVVVGDANESRLELLGDDDYATAGERLNLARAETLSEMTAAIEGGVPGREIWRTVAVLLGALVIAEIVLTRIIAVKRKAHEAAPVTFGAEQVDAEGFRSATRAANAREAQP